MARGGARVSTAQPTEKSANTSRPPTPARAPAREGDGNQLPWPADKVERWSIDRLIPYAKNSRTHSDAQIAQLAASMQEWGWTNPVLADESGGVLCGHARILAARQLGFDEVPVMVARGWSDAQKRAYVIADNQLALNAGWDRELLGLELGELKLGGFDLALVGFGDLELKDLLADRTEGLTDPDDAPAAPEHPVSEPGNLWLLGKHRLLCGDSTVATDVERVLGGVEPHLMVTDPPYGVEYDPAWRDERAQRSPTMGNRKDTAKGAVSNDDKSDWREAYTLFPGDVGYIWHAHLKSAEVAQSLTDSGFVLRQGIIWNKGRIVVGRAHYHWQHEPCWYVVRFGKTGHWNGDRKQSTVWDIDMPRKSETGHSTQKPVECMRRPIENNSSPGQAVYEPFSGSGTTIIAAEMTGRACHAIELSPAYIDVAVKRFQDFSGKQATLDGDGRSFDEIAIARQPRMPADDTADAA